jgi:hypothetical protein
MVVYFIIMWFGAFGAIWYASKRGWTAGGTKVGTYEMAVVQVRPSLRYGQMCPMLIFEVLLSPFSSVVHRCFEQLRACHRHLHRRFVPPLFAIPLYTLCHLEKYGSLISSRLQSTASTLTKLWQPQSVLSSRFLSCSVSPGLLSTLRGASIGRRTRS